MFKEQYSGAKSDRPKFKEMMSLVKPGDTIVVTKLDRLSRDVADGATLAKELREKGIKLHILNMGLVDNTPMGRMIVNMLFAFAEFERDMIIERTQTGREYARENKPGYKEGRKSKITPTIETMVLGMVAQGMSYREIQAETTINRGLVYKIVQADKARKMTEKLDEIKKDIEDTIKDDEDDFFENLSFDDEDEIVDFD